MMADYHWITFLATGIVFGLIIIGVAIWYFCWYLVRRGDQEDGPGYTVAISNRLFKVGSQSTVYHFNPFYLNYIKCNVIFLLLIDIRILGKFHA